MVFWWSSGDSRPRWGCCGGLFILPLAFFTMSAGVGADSIWLLLMGITLVAALFILPRMMSPQGNAFQKRKNDDLYNDLDDEKPKRSDERYILTDDGEILPIEDEDTGTLRQ